MKEATTEAREGYVTVDGVEIAYAEAGSGNPLVLIHGNFGSKRWFTEQLSSPPAGWRLLAPDLPNFAYSQPLPGEISIERYAKAVLGFCDALGLGNFALLGHSLGGAVAQAIAVDQPERVTHLVLVASAAPDGHKTPEEHYALLESLVGQSEPLSAALAATAPSHRPDYFAEIVADALRMRPDAYSGNGRALDRFDITKQTHRYRAPVLVVRGDLDLPHLITEEIARRTAAAYPNSRLELWSGVGHSPLLETPARFNSLLAEFLSETTTNEKEPPMR